MGRQQNRIVKRVAAQYNVPVIDMFEVTSALAWSPRTPTRARSDGGSGIPPVYFDNLHIGGPLYWTAVQLELFALLGESA
jgi:hypothetical protein